MPEAKHPFFKKGHPWLKLVKKKMKEVKEETDLTGAAVTKEAMKRAKKVWRRRKKISES